MATTRRTFMRNTAVAGTALGFPAIIPSTVFGKDSAVVPSERAAIALIGCGNRSGYAAQYKRYAKSEVVAVCDPITSRRLKRKQQYDNCDDYSDFREVLARKDIDGLHITTADHWHVPISLMAARAGKDMYTEKPLGISIGHDIASREIVDKHKRVFQYGAQQRSISHVRMGIELVLNGHIGELKKAYVWAPRGAAGGSPTPAVPVPEGFDYDMWLGPAPEAPFCKDRCLNGGGRNGIFHIYDYAIGFLAGWGAHPADMFQWWADNAGLKTIPVKVAATGVLPTTGLFNTLTNWDATCTYANGLEMRFMDNETANKGPKQHEGIAGGHGTLFVGDKGWVRVARGGWKVFPEDLYKKAKEPGDKRLPVSRDQIQNFVDCILSREQPVDDLHSAVRSDIVCHLIDIAARTGNEIAWDPDKETIVGNEAAAKMMTRPMRKPWTL